MRVTLLDFFRYNRLDKAALAIAAGEFDPVRDNAAVAYLADSEHVDLLRQVLAAGADTNYLSMPTPLATAAKAGRLENVELLLAAGADPDIKAGEPLLRAVEARQDVTARRLVEAGARGGRCQGSILAEAAFTGCAGTVEAMIAAGFGLDSRATIEPADRWGFGQFKLILTKNTLDVQSVPDAPVKPKKGTRAYVGAPAVVIAAGEGHAHIVELLVAAGADPAQADEKGLNAHAAALRGGHLELARRVEELGGLLPPRPVSTAPVLVPADTPAPAIAEVPRKKRRIKTPPPPALDPPSTVLYDTEKVLGRLRDAASDQEFLNLLAELEERCGGKARQELGGESYSVHVHAASRLGKLSESKIEALQAEILARGVLVLRFKGRLLVLPTRDPLEALAAIGTAGPNYDVDNFQVIDFFRRHPAMFTEIGPSAVSGRFDPMPDDSEQLAGEIAKLCPDVVDLDEDSEEAVEALAREIASRGQFSLWWD